MRYRTIVADPPWPHDDGTGVDVRNGGKVTHLPYSTMTLDAIRSLPVHDLSDNLDKEAHLYLWATSRYLPEAFGIARAWGFHYTATLVWCKPSRGFSVGGRFQNNVEFALFCTRPKVVSRPDVLTVSNYLADAADRSGVSRQQVDLALGTSDMGGWWLSRIEYRCACPSWEQFCRIKELVGAGDDMDELVHEINARKGTERNETKQAATSRWFTWGRSAHSQKPDAFLDLVEQVSPGPYVELFARRARFGWDYWGDESLGTATLTTEATA